MKFPRSLSRKWSTSPDADSPPPTPDDELTGLALAAGTGDRRALSEFIRRTQPDVWRFIAHLTDVQSADDLTQETYLRALGSLPRFAGRSSARTWLLSIARRAVIDRLRTASARPRTVPGADWEALLDQRRDRGTGEVGEELVVADMLTHLPDDRREAFVLTQILGLSYAEAAVAVDCPVGTIRSRVARAREQMLELWRRMEAESSAVTVLPLRGHRPPSTATSIAL